MLDPLLKMSVEQKNPYLATLRPRQWTKNLIVLPPLYLLLT